MTWHREVLPAGWQGVAADLASRGVTARAYLAGGTAVALWLGHRRSADLDLFTQAAFDASAMRDRLVGLDGLRHVELAEATLYFELRGIKVSLITYPYPLLFPATDLDGLPVADPRDLGCMKVDAIAARGARRDFLDLHALLDGYALPSLLEWFTTKYAQASFNRAHVLKALTYFDDAEREPEPDMLAPIRWDDVRGRFLREVPALARLTHGTESDDGG